MRVLMGVLDFFVVLLDYLSGSCFVYSCPSVTFPEAI